MVKFQVTDHFEGSPLFPTLFCGFAATSAQAHACRDQPSMTDLLETRRPRRSGLSAQLTVTTEALQAGVPSTVVSHRNYRTPEAQLVWLRSCT
ncbi:hypothetical protein E5288_WYG013371 [Bos mutus]|uniref:Uncharacterized protein n=1 Tax=Bos mutus TaxID=72004 RepID=A0A6B0S0U6_9CETA|nr:hypothetical protein [Bos mutus]